MGTIDQAKPGGVASPPAHAFGVLGVRVDAVQIADVIAQMNDWIRERQQSHYIAVTGMHGVTEAHHDSHFRSVLNEADLVVPDGMPLVWVGRIRGHKLKRRVYGPELMASFFEASAQRGHRHYLYGGAPGVPERLAENMQRRFPGTVVAGTFSPPFGPLAPDEQSRVVEMINRAAPDIIWVGLSTPKQEKWMREYRDRLAAPVLVGVGAAFDILSSGKRQAPPWMREHGLEWLFRLCQEPRRLWSRYLIYGSKFAFLECLEILGLRRWSSSL